VGEHVGAAFLSPSENITLMYKLPPYTSIFTAEAWAIYNSILISLDRGYSRVTLVTDLKSVLDSLQNSSSRSLNYLIPLIKSKLELAEARGILIQFLWIPSHVGIVGNEGVDTLAKRAITEGINSIDKVPFSDMYSLVKENLNNDFLKYLLDTAKFKGTLFLIIFFVTPINLGFTPYPLTEK